MLSIFKRNPTAKLEKKYQSLLKQALEAQRRGDIRTYSDLTAKAEEITRQIDNIKAD